MAVNDRIINFNSLRNLPQYKGKTDDEIAEILKMREFEKEKEKQEVTESLEDRVQIRLNEFEQDYDISDLKYNDRETLRAMMMALISLEDLDKAYYELIEDGIASNNLNLSDKINSMASKLRSDISKMQDDLKISRKIRKSTKEESVQNYIEDLKIKAKEFAESKMSYIFCPKCSMLLGTIWTLYEDENQNQLVLKCNRKHQDETICGEVVKIRLADLAATKTNKPKIMPESLK